MYDASMYHAVKVDFRAPVIYSSTVHINASVEKVWSVLVGIENWPSWQTDIVEAEFDGKLVAGNNFFWRNQGTKIKSKLHTVHTFHAFGWTGRVMGIEAIHNWTLYAAESGTILRCEESMTGILAWILSSVLRSKLASGLEYWLGSLKIECEKEPVCE
mgnify:CR=1 FL=1